MSLVAALGNGGDPHRLRDGSRQQRELPHGGRDRAEQDVERSGLGKQFEPSWACSKLVTTTCLGFVEEVKYPHTPVLLTD
jgi:hypothetical protein